MHARDTIRRPVLGFVCQRDQNGFWQTSPQCSCAVWQDADLCLTVPARIDFQEERVKDAHRRVMQANHPDSGGSSYLAAKVNEAKDMLLGKKSKPGSVF